MSFSFFFFPLLCVYDHFVLLYRRNISWITVRVESSHRRPFYSVHLLYSIHSSSPPPSSPAAPPTRQRPVRRDGVAARAATLPFPSPYSPAAPPSRQRPVRRVIVGKHPNGVRVFPGSSTRTPHRFDREQHMDVVDFVTYLLIEASMASEDAGQQNGRNVDLKTEEKQATLAGRFGASYSMNSEHYARKSTAAIVQRMRRRN
ncbi:hypothetical protein ZWY2020_026740 [Hordeum vulgare]|nr:hypothetical protein ZWY2020_026740 [Hordeum vulgare]